MPSGAPEDPHPSLPPPLVEELARARFRSADPEAAFEALCRAHPEHESALRAALVESSDDDVTQLSHGARPTATVPDRPTHLGPYRIGAVLGEGGMGTVYRAEQEHPVRRTVALKVIKPGMDSREILARFGQERRALAAMNHSNIARIFDAGTTERGQPFFVMEFIDGTPITTWCEQRHLPLRERIELFREVCAGVQHAHQKGVIHRDLKPGNILVTLENDRPVPKILDFGLAKATTDDDIAQSLLTHHEVRMGTPEYMAPEQATRRADQVLDTRADVYSLGVVLYELLTGVLPFEGHALHAEGWSSVQRILSEVEPLRPSARLARGAGTTTLAREVRGDLDWIVMKAMSKEPERRYESADALAEDLRRHLHYEPVSAGPPSALYRARKFVRRYRSPLAAGAAVLVTALAGAAIATDYGIRAEALAGERALVVDFLALAVEGRGLVESVDSLAPARPDKLSALRSWLADADRVVSGSSTDAAPEVGTDFGDFLQRTAARLAEDVERIAMLRLHVERSEHFAAAVERLTFAHPRARFGWDEVRSALAAADGVRASTLYADRVLPLRDEQVVGLVPLGPNPVTLLWEFYDLRSAWDGEQPLEELDIPQHDPEGRIKVTEATGIVFVLLPGGTCRIGSQDSDPDAPFYDADRGPKEQLHEVQLAPFLLARHELTQAQWERLCSGTDIAPRPSRYGAGLVHLYRHVFDVQNVDGTHPVEQVDWLDCDRLLARHGLTLPTEAQWEFACRAGRTTAWCTQRSSLRDFANLADATYKSFAPTHVTEDWPDLHVFHAPVGSFRPNDFGLHDMHGNVWEWCREPFGSRFGGERPGDGLRRVAKQDADDRVNRGGGFDSSATAARCSARSYDQVATRLHSLGVRAARLLDP